MTVSDLVQRCQARVGETLCGKWKLDQLIGVGGMAAVYAATHRYRRRGAVKVLHPEMNLNEEAKRRFLREGYAANRVEHAGVVQVLDDDTAEDGTVFLVMELLEGEDVESIAYQTAERRLSPERAVSIAIRMLEVLEAAHARGVIHRDVKPNNVFVTTEGKIKLLDFGIARVREAAQTSATRAGDVMGTPQFMPPEQALGDWDKVDGRTDLWATGATLFSMLAGRPPHVADSPNKILLAAMSMAAPPLLSVAPYVDPEVAAVVDRALAFDQGARWATATAMRDALQACVERAQQPPSSPEDEPSSDDGPGTLQIRSTDAVPNARQQSLHDGFVETPGETVALDTEAAQPAPALPFLSASPASPGDPADTEKTGAFHSLGRAEGARSDSEPADDPATRFLPPSRPAEPIASKRIEVPSNDVPSRVAESFSRTTRGKSQPRRRNIWALPLIGLLIGGAVASVMWLANRRDGTSDARPRDGEASTKPPTTSAQASALPSAQDAVATATATPTATITAEAPKTTAVATATGSAPHAAPMTSRPMRTAEPPILAPTLPPTPPAMPRANPTEL